MTDRDKHSVSRMRRRGFGYADIARALGVPEGTIKTYCKRNNLHDADLEASYEAWRDFAVPLCMVEFPQERGAPEGSAYHDVRSMRRSILQLRSQP